MHLLLYAPFITIKEKTGQIYIHSLPTQQMGGEMSVLKEEPPQSALGHISKGRTVTHTLDRGMGIMFACFLTSSQKLC